MSAKRTAIELGFILGVSFLAFDGRHKKDARKNATGVCRDCGSNVGRQNTIFGHINHDPRSPDYDSVERNGVERCKVCEARYHLKFVDDPKRIGMTARDALTTAWGHLSSVDEPERDNLEKQYPDKVNFIRKKLRR